MSVKFSDEEQYSYTNYAMETPTPGSDCLPDMFSRLDSLTAIDSDFDESLAVPESLSVIEDKSENKEETDATGEL